jgi:hypothetical protein
MKIRKHHYDNKTQTDNFTSVEKKVHVEQAYLFKHKNSPWSDFGVNGGGGGEGERFRRGAAV